MFVSPAIPVRRHHHRHPQPRQRPRRESDQSKQLTNVRAPRHDEPCGWCADPVTLESAIEFIADDELVEITPKSIRIRKRFLQGARAQRALPRRA